MNKFTHIVDRITRRLGYVVVPAWRWAPNTLEAHLQQLFEMRSVSCVIDVGANTGQYHDFLRYIVGYKGWIASFEPVKANYRALKEKAQGDPRWRVFNCGLGAANGTAEINVMRDTQFSSLLAPDDSVVKQYKNENEVMYRETIEVRRLADVVTDITDQGIPFSQCYLKTDTQGYDIQVVEGAKPILKHVVGMQMELSFRPIYQGMPAMPEVLAFSAALGFQATGLFPISRDKEMRLIEVDCVFVTCTD